MKMNMTIEEKIDNFRELLKHSYQAQKKENVTISYEVLERSGFALSELSDVICPSLVAKGVLRQDFSALAKVEEKFVFEEDTLEKIQDIENRKRVIARTKATDKIQEEINLDAIRRLDGVTKLYIKQITSYEFTVNKNKLNKNKSLKNVANEPLWSLPADTKWEDITIKFQDKEKVEILVRNKHISFSNFKEMRLGKNKPDKRWRLLGLLTTIYATNNQRKDRKDVPATVEELAQSLVGKTNQSAKINIHTVKKSLAFQLQQDFGIHYDDPFDDYNQWGYYKAKFNLIPEPVLRWSGKEGLYDVGGKLNENRPHTDTGEDRDDFGAESNDDID